MSVSAPTLGALGAAHNAHLVDYLTRVYVSHYNSNL